jgi:hypothetical protein
MVSELTWLVLWLAHAIEPDGWGDPYPPVPKQR